jgi:DNA polymerase II small subunit/DNA polymerase delta subunit B
MRDNEVVKYIESAYPEMSSRFKKILDEEYKLFCRKQHDYGSDNITLGEDLSKEEGRMVSLTALVVRMNDKINRLKTIIIKNKGKNAVTQETYMDAFIDLSIYGIIAQLVAENKWGR